MFSLFGGLGQGLYNSLDRREYQPAPTESTNPSPWYAPMRRLTDEEYEHMLQEKIIRVEAEIAIVDESLDKLKEEENGNP